MSSLLRAACSPARFASRSCATIGISWCNDHARRISRDLALTAFDRSLRSDRFYNDPLESRVISHTFP